MFEVADLEDHVVGSVGRVALLPAVLDPRTATADRRADLAWDYRPEGPRRFLIGPSGEPPLGATTAVQAWTSRSATADLQAALDEIAGLLTELGARARNIQELRVYYDPDEIVDEADLRPVIEKFFLGAAPRVRYTAASRASLRPTAVTLEVSGRVTHSR
ncbi:MAG TPA: hypothetical protein VF322_01625 [Gammaproteobacteria bacterium]